jgi:hypothetical protein
MTNPPMTNPPMTSPPMTKLNLQVLYNGYAW